MHTSAIWGHYSVVSFPLQGSTWGVAAVWCQVFFPSWVPSGLTSSRWKKVKVKVVQSCPTLCDPMDFTVCEILQARILEWVAFPFSTQGSNPVLLHCRWILYQLSHKGSPRILKWVAYPFSSGSSWPRNWTGVSCVTGGFLPTEPPAQEAPRQLTLEGCNHWWYPLLIDTAGNIPFLTLSTGSSVLFFLSFFGVSSSPGTGDNWHIKLLIFSFILQGRY